MSLDCFDIISIRNEYKSLYINAKITDHDLAVRRSTRMQVPEAERKLSDIDQCPSMPHVRCELPWFCFAAVPRPAQKAAKSHRQAASFLAL